jgi:uncharacterized protein DUF1629
MSFEYVLWKQGRVAHGVILRKVQGVDDEWELNEGVPRLEKMTGKATFRMDPDLPHYTVLADSVDNISFLIVVSERLAGFLEEKKLEHVEYLPADIIDHKGKRVSTPYFILHPINPVDCLDTERCGPTFDRLDPQYVKRLERLAIKPTIQEQIVAGSFTRPIFRAHNYYRATFVRRELASAISAAGFAGINWVEIEDHPRPRPR